MEITFLSFDSLSHSYSREYLGTVPILVIKFDFCKL